MKCEASKRSVVLAQSIRIGLLHRFFGCTDVPVGLCSELEWEADGGFKEMTSLKGSARPLFSCSVV